MAASSDEQKKVDFKADLLMTEGDSSTDNSTAKKVDLKTGPFKTEGDSSIDNRLAKKVGFTADPFATAGNSSTDIVSAKSSNAAMVSAMTHSQTLSSLPQSTKSKDEFIDINAPVPHSKPIDIQKPRASTIAHTGIYRLDELTDVIADIGDLALDEESTLYLDTKQPKVKGQGIAAASQSKANTQAKDDKEKGPVAQALDPKTEDTDANAQESSGYDPDQTYGKLEPY